MKSYHRNVKSNEHQGGAVTNRSSYRHIKISPQARWQNPTHHQSPQKINEVCMEWQMQAYFWRSPNNPGIPSILQKPNVNLPLIVYIIATKGTVSAAIV